MKGRKKLPPGDKGVPVTMTVSPYAAKVFNATFTQYGLKKQAASEALAVRFLLRRSTTLWSIISEAIANEDEAIDKLADLIEKAAREFQDKK